MVMSYRVVVKCQCVGLLVESVLTCHSYLHILQALSSGVGRDHSFPIASILYIYWIFRLLFTLSNSFLCFKKGGASRRRFVGS